MTKEPTDTEILEFLLNQITPPPEMVRHWITKYGNSQTYEQDISTQAAFWGWQQRDASVADELQRARDEELEACCEWMAEETPEPYINALRTARRPKPKSLVEEAMEDFEAIAAILMREGLPCNTGGVRRALERLQELEGQGDD